MFIFGALIGSFLNVCIYRIPEGKSIVSPRSYCPKCAHPVRSFDNVPLLSYLVLGGHCRDCRAQISPRYFIVELITGLLLVALFLHYGLSIRLVTVFTFSATLIVITFIDLDHQYHPRRDYPPGTPFFFILGIFFMGLTFRDALLGTIAGSGGLFLVAFLYRFFTGREGMGMGDVKLLAMLGAFLGWKSLIFIIFVSSLLGSAVGLFIIFARGKNLKYAVPYGPFLSVAAMAYLFGGDEIMDALLFM